MALGRPHQSYIVELVGENDVIDGGMGFMAT